MYERDYSNMSSEDLLVANNSLSLATMECRYGWQYEYHDGRDSFVTEVKVITKSGIILWVRPANERRRYIECDQPVRNDVTI